MDRFDPFVKYADVYGDIINWEKDPMNKPQNQNKYFFSDGKTYYEQICKMLRLMSVFKEAFNQIYNNEDEISEAWENFVNNLSASVVEGSEPDVTLTWTDDSVNFEFTMVPGVPGEQGVGITSISFNSDYTMTITLSDGNTYTSMSLKGETGPQGPQGETGSGLQILDVYATLADLQSVHPTGQPGDAYQVGSAGNYILYIWSSSQSAWVQAGTLATVSPYTSAPLMDGTASAGSQNLYARGDHVHPSDTSRASKEELDALIKTSQALIDQSFTYRESPAIQDGLARIDKIKGNTLVWNQIMQGGNFESTTGFATSNITDISVSGGIYRATGSSTGTMNAFISRLMPLIVGHKVLVSIKARCSETNAIRVRWPYVSASVNLTANTWTTFNMIGTVVSGSEDRVGIQLNGIQGATYEFKEFMSFDFTQMFGTGNEPSTVEEFTALFPLSYYDYNTGSLLSFNGTGLKTIGFNQWDEEWEVGEISATNGENVPGSNAIRSKNYIPVFPNTAYYFKTGNTAVNTYRHFYDADKNYLGYVVTNTNSVMTTPADARYMRFRLGMAYGTTYNNDVCINISGDKNGIYEPYTESTLSLPVSTNFPTGMKSAGSVYDELTERKAITRVGSVDLGSLTWTYDSGVPRFYTQGISSMAKKPLRNDDIANITSVYETVPLNGLYDQLSDKCMAMSTGGVVSVKDTSYSDLNAFRTAMSGVYLYYELATPTETAVYLDLAFNAYEDGTEQLLPVNGSVPSTSPIIADMTYLSIDDAMAYILEKLESIPEQTEQRLEALEDDVSDLQTDVGTLQTNVSGLQTSVGNINTNIGQLSSTVAGHTASISDMQSDITDLNTGLGNLEDTVTDNTSRIGTLETGLATTNGNVQSLSSQVQSIDGRVTNLESDLFKVVVKEFDYDTVASESNFGTTTPITQEEGYRVIGVVGTEAQAGEYTSPASNIAITQCHIHYTSLGALIITIFGRNTGLSARTNVRIYAYLLCIKDIQ